MYPAVGHAAKHDERFPELWEHTEQEEAYLLKRLAMAGAERTRSYMVNAWIEKDGDGFTGWRWDKLNVQRRLVSACNRYKDVLVCAPRHSCPIMTMSMAMLGGMQVLHKYSGKDHEQGFVDQFGTFYTRKEAYDLAIENGQLLYPDRSLSETLFSEGLY